MSRLKIRGNCCKLIKRTFTLVRHLGVRPRLPGPSGVRMPKRLRRLEMRVDTFWVGFLVAITLFAVIQGMRYYCVWQNKRDEERKIRDAREYRCRYFREDLLAIPVERFGASLKRLRILYGDSLLRIDFRLLDYHCPDDTLMTQALSSLLKYFDLQGGHRFEGYSQVARYIFNSHYKRRPLDGVWISVMAIKEDLNAIAKRHPSAEGLLRKELDGLFLQEGLGISLEAYVEAEAVRRVEEHLPSHVARRHWGVVDPEGKSL